jgi:hypothetical protein
MGVINKQGLKKLELQMKDLSPQEMKELLMINTYKLALARSQLEALTDILVKHHLTTREEVWKKTEENFEDST